MAGFPIRKRRRSDNPVKATDLVNATCLGLVFCSATTLLAVLLLGTTSHTVATTRKTEINWAEGPACVPVKCQRETHSESEVLVHKDQSTQMAVNVPAMRRVSGAMLARFHSSFPKILFLPYLFSYSEFATTRNPRIVQNKTSISVIGNVPRSQNHWYE